VVGGNGTVTGFPATGTGFDSVGQLNGVVSVCCTVHAGSRDSTASTPASSSGVPTTCATGRAATAVEWPALRRSRDTDCAPAGFGLPFPSGLVVGTVDPVDVAPVPFVPLPFVVVVVGTVDPLFDVHATTLSEAASTAATTRRRPRYTSCDTPYFAVRFVITPTSHRPRPTSTRPSTGLDVRRRRSVPESFGRRHTSAREPTESSIPMYSQNVLDIDPTTIAQMMAAGHRFTKSRQLILTTLATLGRPATIPAILAAEPHLSQSSLYRNLMILEAAGLVSRLTVGSDYALFELSEELTEHHHHHLVCRQCHTVADIDLPAATERLLDETLAEATAASGFMLEDHRLDLVGLCGECVVSNTTPHT